MSLVLDGLVKRFGAVTALDGISFEVPSGQVFGFLGANGAGKTTTMRIVLDILRPDAGTASWMGTSTTEVPRETWGYLPEERGLYPRLQVLDQLVFFASLYGIPRDVAATRAREWLARLRIPDYATRRAEELSKGNQQKVQLIAAILHEPAVLLMDEPFVGLDPVNVALLKEAFGEMRERGSTLIFSTHQMEMVEELCESVALIDRGRLVLAGPIRDVKRSTGRRVVRLALEGRALDSDAAIPWLALDSGRADLARGRRTTRSWRPPRRRPGADPADGARPRRAGDELPDRRPVDRGDLHRAGRSTAGAEEKHLGSGRPTARAPRLPARGPAAGRPTPARAAPAPARSARRHSQPAT